MKQLEILIQCLNFERRLSWMLSSIVLQENLGNTKILPSIVAVKGHGNHLEKPSSC